MLKDSFDRVIDYLRISVTSNCNFRCKYCMPNGASEDSSDFLSFDELFYFVKNLIDQGIKKIRITGGEPLLRKDICKFIKSICDYKKDIDIGLTTNGFLLSNLAKELSSSGLKRLNISLDTLQKDKFIKISNKDALDKVLDGIDASLSLNFKIKLNSVIIKGINDDEILDLLEFANERRIEIRFIEFMQNIHAGDIKGVGMNEILDIIKTRHKIIYTQKFPQSPSLNFTLDNGQIFGIIAPHKDDFCKSCNRIRLSAKGELIPCLYHDEAKSIKEAIKTKNIDELNKLVKEVIKNKPEKNRWSEEITSNRAFYKTGG